jgi:hypothetical protein
VTQQSSGAPEEGNTWQYAAAPSQRGAVQLVGMCAQRKQGNALITLYCGACAEPLLDWKRNNTFHFRLRNCSCQQYTRFQSCHGNATVGSVYAFVGSYKIFRAALNNSNY